MAERVRSGAAGPDRDDPHRWHRLDAATRHLPAPLVAVDRAALDRNADRLTTRAAGVPIRLATKSVRCRELIRTIAARPGFRGLLAHDLAEAIWLVRTGTSQDVVVAYPSVSGTAIAELCADPALAAAITITVDDPGLLDLVDAIAPPARRPPVRVCLDLDAGSRWGPLVLGARRSAIRTPVQAERLARTVVGRAGYRLVGALSYEGQIAGVGDAGGSTPLERLRLAAVAGAKRWSAQELAGRRGEVIAAIRSVADLEFVNGGGTGSIESTTADPSITELGVGSGLFVSHLFDHYRAFRAEPACGFALEVTRRPGPGWAVVHGGGWVASGAAGPDRLPVPVHPPGLRLTGLEGAGEVQTPLRVPPALADSVAVGSRVWFRHAKAGEVADRVAALHIVDDDGAGQPVVVASLPTYRGEGRGFV